MQSLAVESFFQISILYRSSAIASYFVQKPCKLVAKLGKIGF